MGHAHIHTFFNIQTCIKKSRGSLFYHYLLTRIAFKAKDLLVSPMGKHSQEGLSSEADQVLLLQRHGSVHTDIASLTWVTDPCRQSAYHQVGTLTLTFYESFKHLILNPLWRWTKWGVFLEFKNLIDVRYVRTGRSEELMANITEFFNMNHSVKNKYQNLLQCPIKIHFPLLTNSGSCSNVISQY